MRGAMSHWGPDGVRCWSGGAGGLGQCVLCDTPEAVHETLPAFTEEGSFAFTAEARLDNRDDLFDALSVEHAERPAMPDGELMRRAYHRWGTECPAKLFGDWSLAAWHPLERKLFLARDHHGETSLHYFSERNRFAFASDHRAILGLPRVSRQLNDVYDAQVLVLWNSDRQGVETIYRDIYRLPPAHALLATPAGVRSWRYWRLEDAPDVRLKTADDYADGLREHLRQAITARLRTAKPVAVALSAGLDSGSVAVLAARELAKSGRSLTAVTTVPTKAFSIPGAICNEFPLASETARMAANIRHVPVGSAHPGPVEGIELQLANHGDLGATVPNYYWLAQILERVRGHVLLTGQGGNASISWTGVPDRTDVAAALAADGITGAVKAAAWLGPIGSARRARGHFQAVRRGGAQPWRRYSAIHPQFAERTRLRELMAAAGYDPTFTRWPRGGRARRLDELRPGKDVVGALWAELGAATEVSTRDPTMDARLLWFAVGVPNRYWRGPQDRWLIREAMQGWLPDEVRLGSRLGRPASDMTPRLIEDSRRVAELFLEIEASEKARGYVDVEYMRGVLGALRAAPASDAHLSSGMLLSGLAAGLFLARA